MFPWGPLLTSHSSVRFPWVLPPVPHDMHCCLQHCSFSPWSCLLICGWHAGEQVLGQVGPCPEVFCPSGRGLGGLLNRPWLLWAEAPRLHSCGYDPFLLLGGVCSL